MKELTIFKNEKFGEVRTIIKNGEPWWVLMDICKILDLTNTTKVAERLDSDEVTKFDLGGLSGEINIVNESGLYSVILRSDKPSAKEFRRWVTHEIIPQIRKHGVYATDEILNNPDIWIKALQELKSEREKNALLNETIVKDKPKVLFADSVAASDTTILIGELAKILKGNGIEIGQNRLFDRLRKDGFLIKRTGTDYNMPTQKAMELGLLKVKETAVTHADGHISVCKTTKVTGKGQQYFINMFLEHKCTQTQEYSLL